MFLTVIATALTVKNLSTWTVELVDSLNCLTSIIICGILWSQASSEQLKRFSFYLESDGQGQFQVVVVRRDSAEINRESSSIQSDEVSMLLSMPSEEKDL